MRFVPFSDLLVQDAEEVAVDPSDTYRMAGVRSFGRGLFDKGAVAGSSTSYSRLYRIRVGQVVMSQLFAWEGAIAPVEAGFDGYFVSPEFPTFGINTEIADPQYVGHYVRWTEFHGQLAGSARGLGQRRSRVHPREFLALKIPLPSIDEQRVVVRRLDDVRNGQADAAWLRAKATVLGRGLRDAIVTRGDLSASEKVRRGWVQQRLGEGLSAVSSPVAVESTGRYNIAGVFSFGRGLIDRGEISGADTAYKMLNVLRNENVVVSKLNGWEGAVAVVDPSFDGYCVSSEFPVFEVDSKCFDPRYLAGLVRTQLFWDLLNDEARGSMVRRRRISGAQFLDAQVWCPPLSEQARLGHAIAQLEIRESLVASAHLCLGNLVSSAINHSFAHLK